MTNQQHSTIKPPTKLSTLLVNKAMNDDEMQNLNNIFARLDAWDLTTATQRIPATKLPPEVIARVRKSMAMFRFRFGSGDLDRKQHKEFVCLRAKVSK